MGNEMVKLIQALTKEKKLTAIGSLSTKRFRASLFCFNNSIV